MNAKEPRTGEHATKPGRYELLYRISDSIVDPGGDLTIELYVSGYGEIVSSKLAVYPSAELFDVSRSSITFGAKQAEDSAVIFGGQAMPLPEHGGVLDLSGGIQIGDWKRSTLYFDTSDSPVPQIMTETNQRRQPPIGMKLVTQRKAKPGSHFIQASLTYFNGEEWQTSGLTIRFTISSFYQRHEGLVWILGAVAAGAGIVSLVFDIIDVMKT